MSDRAFTIRIPSNLADQIETRAALNRRSRNREIEWLLESAIEVATQRDLKTLEEMGARQKGR